VIELKNKPSLEILSKDISHKKRNVIIAVALTKPLFLGAFPISLFLQSIKTFFQTL